MCHETTETVACLMRLAWLASGNSRPIGLCERWAAWCKIAQRTAAGRAWLRNLGFCAKPALAFELSQVKDAPRSEGIVFYIGSTLYRDFGIAMCIALSPSALPVRTIGASMTYFALRASRRAFLRAFPWCHMGESQILYPNCCSGIASLFSLRNTIPYFAKVWRQFSSAGVGSTSSHRVLAVRRQWKIFTRTRTRLVWDSGWSPKRPRLCILI